MFGCTLELSQLNSTELDEDYNLVVRMTHSLVVVTKDVMLRHMVILLKRQVEERLKN
jgi:hypothetical protein